MMDLKNWLVFFRVVNLPTVPGDILVGAACVCVFVHDCGALPIIAAAVASCGLYLFGLADNDIVGAKSDGPERPIPSGRITLGAARLARGLCLFAAMIAGAAANLSPQWWIAASLLALAIVFYNRTKNCLLMGLCRGLNVVCGGAIFALTPALLVAALVWTAYIAGVTRYSRGEEENPAKRKRVGMLIGALVYLQLAALLAFYEFAPSLFTRNLLLSGAACLLLLRILKRSLPNVSAS